MKRPKILLRSGWQIINIGDIAITPGMLRLLEDHFPEAEVTLELWNGADPIRQMLARGFPRVRIMDYGFGQLGQEPREEYVRAMREADLFLYSSGPIFSYGRNNFSWDLLMLLAYPCFMAMDFGTPWGCYGQSFDRFAPPSEYFYRDLLGRAEFLFCRDTDSLKLLHKIGISGPTLDFTPDATFAFDLRDGEKGRRVLEQFGLEEKRFLVAIPHYRADQALAEKTARILEHWLRETDLPVLLAPETKHNVAQNRDQLRPLITEDLRDRVHALDHFWLPDEAAWVYERAALLFSAEMHSVIMALGAGTPCVMFRLQGTGDAADALAAGLSQEEHTMSDGLKNRMMEDLELGDWLFYRSEDARAEDVANRLLHIHRNPKETARIMEALKARLKELQAGSMATVESVARRG